MTAGTSGVPPEVRMKFARETAVSVFDRFGTRLAGEPEALVIVFITHGEA